MRIPPLEEKDITFFLAVKPHMSTRTQQILDVLLFLTRPSPQSQEDILDPVPILNLLSLVKSLSHSPETPPAEPSAAGPAAITAAGHNPLPVEDEVEEEEEQREEEG